MNNRKQLFWFVDVQHDFMDKDGKLYVEGAEDIKGNLKKVKEFVDDLNLNAVFTMDWHYHNSPELSTNPDFVNTFPEHCMAGTIGASIIPEVKPSKDCPIIINWDQEADYGLIDDELHNKAIDIILRKDEFDFIKGNFNSSLILALLKSLGVEEVYVVGVAGNVCVNYAVTNLLKNFKVNVIKECIKDLPNIPSCVNNWEKSGAKMISISDLKKENFIDD
jgi:nicotinamidase/pyrazinamidase